MGSRLSCRWQRIVLALLGIAVVVAGCGPSDSKPTARKKKAPPARAVAPAEQTASETASRPTAETRAPSPDSDSAAVAESQPKQRRLPPGFGPAQMPTGPRTFSDLIASGQDASESPAAVSVSAAQEGDA
ncbi:MAG: hypothetical protein MUE50_21350, partial [Pirellulaceae bacterium]|nr:hypothetical protein [Pirellulaceae bacterium]